MKGTATRSHWGWGTAGAVVVVAALPVLFRAPHAAAPAAPPREIKVRLDSNPALRDEAAIFDPTPLFLPTKLNAAPRPLDLPPPGAAFPDYQPRLGFAEMELKLDALALPAPIGVPPRPQTAPGAVLALPAPGALGLGFGRTDAAVTELKPRGGFVEITAAGDGRRLLSQPLPEAVRPPGGDKPWQPLEFVAAVDAAGLVGPPVPTVRSGVEEVDTYFQNYLARTLRVGERLPPGFYRICVGP